MIQPVEKLNCNGALNEKKRGECISHCLPGKALMPEQCREQAEKRQDGDEVAGIGVTDHLTEKEISAFRRKNLGFVFQDFNLLDTFSLRDNIYLPFVLAGEDYQEMEQKIRPIAKALHIDQLLEKFP